MSEKIKVGMRGRVVIPKKVRKKLGIENGSILEINVTDEGLFLKPFNQVGGMKGLGKGVFGDPVKYQKKLREERECSQRKLHRCCALVNFFHFKKLKSLNRFLIL